MYEQEYDFLNCVDNLCSGWTNWYWYEDNKNKLLGMRAWAYRQKPTIKNLFDIDVACAYEQLDEFENLVSKCKAPCRREAIIITALAYAANNRPIINTKISEGLAALMDNSEKNKNVGQFRLDVMTDLLNYYFENYKTPAYYEGIQKIFPKYAELEKSINDGAYLCGRVIKYLKILLYYKDVSAAVRAFKNYPITPTNKKDTADYEKIKLKLNIE